MADRIISIVAAGSMLAISASPTVAGMLMRATASVWFAWAGVITEAQYMAFSMNAHF